MLRKIKLVVYPFLFFGLSIGIALLILHFILKIQCCWKFQKDEELMKIENRSSSKINQSFASFDFFVFRVRQYISRFRHFHFQSIFRFWRHFCRSILGQLWVHWRLEDPRNGGCKSHWPPFEISNKERIVRRSRKKPQRHTQEKRRGDRKSCIRLFCWILLCTFHDYVLLDFFSSPPTPAHYPIILTHFWIRAWRIIYYASHTQPFEINCKLRASGIFINLV